MQRLLFEGATPVKPFRAQLLKWVGNKQKHAAHIVSYFPSNIRTYYEPFLGSGAVLATLTPKVAVGSDCFQPLIEIWQTLRRSPGTLKSWYAERWHKFMEGDASLVYEAVRSSYNSDPNGADLLFLCRTCYGGVVRFRKSDGHISTPLGVHRPISPDSFSQRVDEWFRRTAGADFLPLHYEEAMEMAGEGDFVYCDPPYHHSQAILYGAQDFDLEHLLRVIDKCKARGVRVALSIDGKKRSGTHVCSLPLPDGLFEREVFISCGRSMLKRFQMNGRSLENEVVADRLLLTY